MEWLCGSLTVMVMIAEPDWFGRGVMRKVRLLPVPPMTMSTGRTRSGLLDARLTVSCANGVSGSPMVTGIKLVSESSWMT